MEEDKLCLESQTCGTAMDKDGKILREYNKNTKEDFNINKIKDENRIAIDAMMMTNAIIKPEFKNLLISNIGADFPYTTEICKKETIGNLTGKYKFLKQKAEQEFENLKNQLNIKFLKYEEKFYFEAKELFDRVKTSKTKIRKIETFFKDCVNIIIFKKSNILIFFSNDEDLEKVCKKFNIKIEFIKIADSSQKIIKDWRKESYNKKFRYLKKGKRARR